MDNNGCNAGSSAHRCVEGTRARGRAIEAPLAKRRPIYYKGNKRALQTFFFEIFRKLREIAEKKRRGGAASRAEGRWDEFEDNNGFNGQARNKRKNRDESGIIGARRFETN